jgi:hypothetical protein
MSARPIEQGRRRSRRISLPVYTADQPSGHDVLNWPAIGRFLRWRHARVSLQLALLMAAVAVLLHGWLGPDLAPRNLATVLTWVHYRGLLVMGLLAFGNLFCAGCPFILVRDAGRRLHAPKRRWPRWLRGKWIGIVSLIGVLFAYELFDLWASPAATAWLMLGYFAAALVVDVLFKGAVFCKHICPIGQYNFVASTMSPFELRIKNGDTCQQCATHDCIRGTPASNRTGQPPQRGCELGLFLPRKVGNIDCTLCLDCVHACPHDNIALASRVPGLELAHSGRRSGIGHIDGRLDLTILTVVFVFASLLNAFGMVRPVYALERWLADLMGTSSELPVLAVMYVVGLGVFPAVLIGAAAAAARALAFSANGLGIAAIARRYARSLLPLGFSVWLAHYGFHLLTGLLTVIPVAQSAANDLAGWPILGQPRWTLMGLRPGGVYPIQIGFLLLGAIGSIAVAFRLSQQDRPLRTIRATLPWAALVLTIAIVAAWVLAQPMEMRGIVLGGG